MNIRTSVERTPEKHPLSEGVFVSEAPETFVITGESSLPHDSVQWSLQIPRHLKYPGLALIGPGYMGIYQSSEALQDALVAEDIATVRFGPARNSGESFLHCVHDPQKLHVDSVDTILDDLQTNKREIGKSIPAESLPDFEQVAFVAHSMFGLAVTRVARRAPGRTDAIFGLATTGLGHPKPHELIRDVANPLKFAGVIRHEIIPALHERSIAITRDNIKDFVQYYRAFGRFVCEGVSCVNVDVSDQVRELDTTYGIPYHYLAFGRDILVRADPDIKEVVRTWGVMEKYGHLAPQVKAPHVASYIAGVLGLRDNVLWTPTYSYNEKLAA